MPDRSKRDVGNHKLPLQAFCCEAIEVDDDDATGAGCANKAPSEVHWRQFKSLETMGTGGGIMAFYHWPLKFPQIKHRPAADAALVLPSKRLSSAAPAALSESSSLSPEIALEVERNCKPCTDDGSWVLNNIPAPRVQSFQVCRHDRKSQIGFRDVRRRTGIRGFAVEIRPAKWKHRIWLGTYDTEEEAARAYDAGVFYGKAGRQVRFNFPELEGTFPPLPSHLRLDSADDRDEIKIFVQKQARRAASTAKNNDGILKGGSANILPPTQIMNQDLNNSAVPNEATTPAAATDAKLTCKDAHPEAVKVDQHDTEGKGQYNSDSDEATEFIDYQGLFEFECESDDDSVSGAYVWAAPYESHESLSRDCEELPTSGRKRSIDEDSELMSRLAPSIRKHVEDALLKSEGRDTPIDVEDDLISRLAPSIRKEVADALNSTLLPLVSALRTREEDEQKHREKMLALEEAKLALRREKLLLKRRRVARYQPHPRPSSSCSGNRVKKNHHPTR